jgi:hypothetical protein
MKVRLEARDSFRWVLYCFVSILKCLNVSHALYVIENLYVYVVTTLLLQPLKFSFIMLSDFIIFCYACYKTVQDVQ